MCMSISLSINPSFYLSTYVDVYMTYIRSQTCDTHAQDAQLHGSAPGRARCMRHPPTHADTHTYMHGHAYTHNASSFMAYVYMYIYIYTHTYVNTHTYCIVYMYSFMAARPSTLAIAEQMPPLSIPPQVRP